jgi:hypothetical protein
MGVAFVDKKANEQYNEREAATRFEAALKGARIAGHKPMESLTRKAAKKQSKKVTKKARP